MPDQIQKNRPLKGLSHIAANNASPSKITLPTPVTQLPKDMYLHVPVKSSTQKDGCPTEWWWHTGTLTAADGRVFGFEINAAAFYPDAFTEVMLTDVQNQKHYKQTSPTLAFGDTWAESDPSKEWQVNLLDVHMHAPQADPTQNMVVKAKLVDGNTTVTFDLTLSQKGLPLHVWGTGVTPIPVHPTTATNNYYFSLTRLKATGTIVIGQGDVFETIPVSGVTWMDHEWGLFSSHGHSVKWILQDMQLDNGVCISNFSLQSPVLNETSNGKATVQSGADGTSYYVDTQMTPTQSWKESPQGKEFFTEIKVVIPQYGAEFFVKSSMNAQLFTTGASVYEGVGTVSGTLKVGSKIESVTGTAWIEQTN